VQKVLKVNGELPLRSSWSRSAKSWEIELKVPRDLDRVL
jgi:hypothetical protein